MADTEIIRKQIVVIDSVGENQYKDMTFKDKEGHDYKISAKRTQYFKDKIIQGQAIQLNYAMSDKFKKEYIYSAEVVKDGLQPERKPEPHPMANVPLADMPPETMKKSDWAEKDRITRQSIEAQTAFNGVVQLMVAKNCPTELVDRAVGWALSKLPLKEAPKSAKAGEDTTQASKTPPDAKPKADTPATAEQVNRDISRAIKENLWGLPGVKAKVTELGGSGDTIFLAIRSLKPDKLAELNKVVQEILKPIFQEPEKED